MRLMNPFDAKNYDPTQGLPQLPVGKHPVIIRSSEVKPTSDGNSGMLVFELQIIDGPSKGATGAYRLNLYHTNQQTVEIAHRQLSAVCHVTGVYNVQDSEQLHNIPFMVEVALQKDAEAAAKGYTQVVRVFDRNGNEPGKAGAGQQMQQPGNQQPGGQQQPPQGSQGGQQQPAWGQQPQNGQQGNQQQPQGGGGGWGGNNGGGGNQPPQGGQQQPQNGTPWGQQQPGNGGNGGNQQQPAWGR
jgi:hypothetical protein